MGEKADKAYKKLMDKQQQRNYSKQLMENPTGKKSGRGGARAGAGAKPRVSREWLITQLAPDYNFVYAKWLECIEKGDQFNRMPAITKWMNYFLGMPSQHIQTEISGKDGAPLEIKWVEQRTYTAIDITPDQKFIENDNEDDPKLIDE